MLSGEKKWRPFKTSTRVAGATGHADGWPAGQIPAHGIVMPPLPWLHNQDWFYLSGFQFQVWMLFAFPTGILQNWHITSVIKVIVVETYLTGVEIHISVRLTTLMKGYINKVDLTTVVFYVSKQQEHTPFNNKRHFTQNEVDLVEKTLKASNWSAAADGS